MGCGRYHVRVRQRRRVLATRDESGDMGHVHPERRSDLVGDLPKDLPVNDARIDGRAA